MHLRLVVTEPNRHRATHWHQWRLSNYRKNNTSHHNHVLMLLFLKAVERGATPTHQASQRCVRSLYCTQLPTQPENGTKTPRGEKGHKNIYCPRYIHSLGRFYSTAKPRWQGTANNADCRPRGWNCKLYPGCLNLSQMVHLFCGLARVAEGWYAGSFAGIHASNGGGRLKKSFCFVFYIRVDIYLILVIWNCFIKRSLMVIILKCYKRKN